MSKDLANQAIKMGDAIEVSVNSKERSVIWQEKYVTRTSYDNEDTTNEYEFFLFQLVNSYLKHRKV